MSWFGELPEWWRAQRIKNLLSLRDERNYLPLSEVRLLSLYTAIGVIPHDEIERVAGNVAVTADNYKKVYKDDIVVNIILCWQGAIGLSKWDGVTSPAYDVYRAKSDIVNVDYFNYLFRIPLFSGECYKVGHGIMAMRWRTYSDEFTAITVPLPPREEQDQIVRYLNWKVSQINKLINAKRKQIALLQEQKRVVINEAVNNCGKRVRLKQVFRIFNGATPKSDIARFWDGDICWITPVDLSKTEMYVENSIRQITQEGFNSCSTSLIPKNNIVLATRAPIGNVRINKVDLCTNQGCKSLVLINSDNSVEFFFYLLSALEKHIQSLGDGTTFSELSNTKLSNILLQLPTVEEQAKIVAYLNNQCKKIDKLITTLNDEIALFTEYRTRLISDVVTGKLDVRGVVVPEYEAVEDGLEDEDIKEMNEVEAI